jgi:hypothetical protein
MNRVVLVISAFKFCRGYAMQFEESDAKIGRDIGFCTEPHIASVLYGSRSERLLDVPYSENGIWPSHSIWCSPFRNHRRQTSDRMWRPNSWKFQRKPTTGDSDKERIDAQGSYFEGDYVCVALYTTITMQYHHSGNFLTAHHMYMSVYVCACVRVCIYTIRNTICTIYFNIKKTQNYVRRLNFW